MGDLANRTCEYHMTDGLDQVMFKELLNAQQEVVNFYSPTLNVVFTPPRVCRNHGRM